MSSSIFCWAAEGELQGLEGKRYCEVDGSGRITRGDERGRLNQADAEDLDEQTRQQTAQLFLTFEQSLSRVRRVEHISPETERALRALGYIR